MNTKAWYVLHSKPNREGQLYQNLQARGIETFYPTVCISPVNPRSSRVKPYFPGYLFVRIDLGAVGVSAVQWIPGAQGLIQFDGWPANVSELLIQRLRQHVSQLATPYTADKRKPDHLSRGDPVHITDGSLAGHEAIFDTYLSGAERARVLIQMLGRSVRVSMNVDAIARWHA